MDNGHRCNEELKNLKQIFPGIFLTIIIAFPYIILVGSMGYIRQGMAMGFILYSYSYLIKDKKTMFIFLTIIRVIAKKTTVFCYHPKGDSQKTYFLNFFTITHQMTAKTRCFSSITRVIVKKLFIFLAITRVIVKKNVF